MPPTVPTEDSSPFAFSVDLTKVAIVAVLGLLAFGFYYLTYVPVRDKPPAQPSVPSLVPPPCGGRCNPAKVSPRPFNVSCPYCRNVLSVRPDALDVSTGEVVGSTVTGLGGGQPAAK